MSLIIHTNKKTLRIYIHALNTEETTLTSGNSHTETVSDLNGVKKESWWIFTAVSDYFH